MCSLTGRVRLTRTSSPTADCSGSGPAAGCPLGTAVKHKQSVRNGLEFTCGDERVAFLPPAPRLPGTFPASSSSLAATLAPPRSDRSSHSRPHPGRTAKSRQQSAAVITTHLSSEKIYQHKQREDCLCTYLKCATIWRGFAVRWQRWSAITSKRSEEIQDIPIGLSAVIYCQRPHPRHFGNRLVQEWLRSLLTESAQCNAVEGRSGCPCPIPRTPQPPACSWCR